MKVGILSMQRVANNGSFLQAYALKTTLERLGADEVEFVDFHNSIVDSSKRLSIIKFIKKIKHLILPKYWEYEKVLYLRNKFHRMMNQKYQRTLFPVENNYLGNKEYDLVIYGSDEVFNICQFSDLGKDIPWELMGEGSKAKKLISYAAAAGQTSIHTIELIGEDGHCKELLSRFSALSARDTNTLELLRHFGKCKPELHIDPVLLLDEFPYDDTYKKLTYKYMVIYAYTLRINSLQEISAIKGYAKKHRLKTVCINCFQTWCDVSIIASPFALLQYIKDSECVVTDTFHGTIFSIRNNKRFATIIRESNSNKLVSLLNQFGLQDRIVSSISALESILDKDIDYKYVEERLEKERKKATDYLINQINLWS